MPVTVKTRPEEDGDSYWQLYVRSFDELFKSLSKDWRTTRPGYKSRDLKDCSILLTSLEDLQISHPFLIPDGDGFVQAVISYFEQGVHLVLRPDDIWLAILAQLNFYVNGNADKMKDTFVTRQQKESMSPFDTPPKKEAMEVDFKSTPVHKIDSQQASEGFTRLLKTRLVDDSLSEWLLPAFSTTTADDKTVSALTIVSPLDSYPGYRILHGGDGFPSVTLEGQKKDWEELASKIGRLANYGHELAEWSQYLTKVAEKMIESFDKPDDEKTREFWMRASNSFGMTSFDDVMHTLSGWLTAFSYWTDEGKKSPNISDQDLKEIGPLVYGRRLILDGLEFPVLRCSCVPKTFVEVPVKVRDENALVVHETTVFAGFVGVQDVRPGRRYVTHVQPVSGWWMLEDKPLEPCCEPEITWLEFYEGLEMS